MRRLQKRGFPENLRNWRFVTLTLDRAVYPDPEAAYDLAKRHLREFIYALRREYSIPRWCWKLEFHAPDERTGEIYPHWHLLLDYKRPIPAETLERLWGKGRTQIRGVCDEGMKYLFKYVGKGADSLPEWILSRRSIRLFQTSKGFFPAGSAPRKRQTPSPRHAGDSTASDTQNEVWREVVPGVFVTESRDRESRDDVPTLGERLQRWTRSVVSRSETEDGSPRYKLHLACGETWGAILVSASKAKLAHNTGDANLSITTNRIHASCYQYLPKNLLVYQ